MHNLWNLYTAVAAAVPEREAVRWRERTITHAQLVERSLRLANVLSSHGLGPHRDRRDLQPWEAGQDLVGTYLLNGPEYVEVTLAGFASRTAPFNVNYRYVTDELVQLLDDADARALVYHARFADRVADVLPRLRRAPLLLQVADDTDTPLLAGALDYEQALADAPTELAADGHHPDDLYIVYTGGTTGMPRGTLWRQADMWTATLGGDEIPGNIADVAAAAAAVTSPRRFLPNAPFMHAAAQWLALRSLYAGGAIIVNSVVDHLEPSDVWHLVDTQKINSTLMVGESFARPLLDELDRGGYDPSSLKLIVVGGAATTPETKRRILAAIPGVRLLDAAGASETGTALRSVATSGDQIGEETTFVTTAGVAVLDEALDHVVEPGHDGVGWFAKQGAIPLGYLNDEDKTRRTFPVVAGARWSVPGDRARLRADGTIDLLGRDAATINTAGEKVFAEEVEAALLVHPAVRDVVVVGRPSERWGQEVVAVVSLFDTDDPVSDDDMLTTAGQHLARYKLPKAIVRVDHVVRTPTGKADLPWARERAVSSERDPQPG